MNASFGIDHPLLATYDINALRNLLSSLGFNITAIGKHPWGTSTSLAMFNGCLLEVMGIYDDTAGFHVAGHLEFGRDVTLPDGTAGRTKTTLAMLPDPQFPRLSLGPSQQRYQIHHRI